MFRTHTWLSTAFLLCVAASVPLACGSDSKTKQNEPQVAQHEHTPGLLGNGVARYLPDDVAPEDLFPSFALVEPRYPTGPVPEGWGPGPTFDVEGETHVASIAIAPGTDLYGTGEIAGPLLRTGARTQAWTEMPNPTSGEGGFRFDDTYDRLYQAHPWVLAVRADGSAFGVLADTTRRTWIDLADGIRFEAPTAFPVIVIQGASPQEVLTELADLTGHLDLPPRWALGHHQSRFSYVDAAALRGIAEDLREHQIPTDVLWFDGSYMDEYRLFTFNEEKFPDPKRLISDLHDMNFRVVPIFDPGVRDEESFPLYQEALSGDMLLTNPDGTVFLGTVWGGNKYAFPDFSQRTTRDWWSMHMSSFVQAYGFDGVWDDLNEPVFYGVDRWYPPEDATSRGDEHFPPGTQAEYHNVYALQQLEATEAAFRQAYPDRRPFILTRANYIGGQRHAAMWTGDNTATWQHLLWSIAMIGNMGLSGQPFSGADIGGFFVPKGAEGTDEPWDPELFAHWMGIGAFYPFCRNHSAGTDDPFTANLGGGPPHHAWDFGPDIERTYRQAVERRYRLLPYLYTLFHEASQSGIPVLRPVFFAEPSQARLRREDRAFLFGADLLIVPQWPDGVLADDSPLELPDGFEHEITLVGEQPDVDAAHPHIRLRSGAIVPATVVGQTTRYDPSAPLDLYIALDESGAASGSLYEDDGDGNEYQSGQYRLIALRAETVDGKVIVTLEREEGAMDMPARVLRAHLYSSAGVTIAEGMTDRVELAAP